MSEAHVVARDVCVDFGCSDVGVPEEGLDAAEVGAAAEEVSREGVAKLVRVHAMSETRRERVVAHDFPEALAGESAAARGAK